MKIVYNLVWIIFTKVSSLSYNATGIVIFSEGGKMEIHEWEREMLFDTLRSLYEELPEDYPLPVPRVYIKGYLAGLSLEDLRKEVQKIKKVLGDSSTWIWLGPTIPVEPLRDSSKAWVRGR